MLTITHLLFEKGKKGTGTIYAKATISNFTVSRAASTALIAATTHQHPCSGRSGACRYNGLRRAAKTAISRRKGCGGSQWRLYIDRAAQSIDGSGIGNALSIGGNTSEKRPL